MKAKNKSFKMKERSLQRALEINSLEYALRAIEYGTQYKLTTKGFERISINHYTSSDKVVIQPYDDKIALLVQWAVKSYGKLRRHRLKHKNGVKK